jgi:hypothetical protein
MSPPTKRGEGAPIRRQVAKRQTLNALNGAEQLNVLNGPAVVSQRTG